MKRRFVSTSPALLVTAAIALVAIGRAVATADDDRPGVVHSANLVYGDGQTSQCFAHHFLADAQRQTNIFTAQAFDVVGLESPELFRYPFAVMSGECPFVLTESQRTNLRAYLTGGGFLVASPGCSSPPWRESFLREVRRVFPDTELTPLPLTHPIFATVYNIKELKTKRRGVTGQLLGLIVDGRVVMVYSPEGLNDTANAGGDCCCCGGNEILNARQINVNLLIYALTH